jgi:hypothetical protein
VASKAEELSRIYGAVALDVVDGLRRLADRCERFATPAADGSHVSAARDLLAEIVAAVGNVGPSSLIRSAQEADAAAGAP